MNKVFAFTLLAFLVLGGRVAAQGYTSVRQAQDMVFLDNFIPTGDSPLNSGLLGEAVYDRGIFLEFYPNLVVNLDNPDRLVVSTLLSSPPTDAWILEKKSNGSLSRVAEITNLVDDPTYGLYYMQTFTLTPTQIHSLIEGDWYEEVDFGATNYLENFAPQYSDANGPLAIPVVRSPVFRPSSYEPEIIAVDNRAAGVILDGSESIDPFYLPMQYSWSSLYESPNNAFTNSGVMVTRTLNIGTHVIQFQVNDAIADGIPFILFVQVITPAQAVNSLISDVSDSALTQQQQGVLIDLLSNAATQFDRGEFRQGCLSLEHYLHRLRLFSASSALSQPAENILDAFRVGTEEKEVIGR